MQVEAAFAQSRNTMQVLQSSSSRVLFARQEPGTGIRITCPPQTASPCQWHRLAFSPSVHTHKRRMTSLLASTATSQPSQPTVQPEAEIPGMTQFLDSLKYDKNGLVAVVVQHVDTGEVLMQAFADRAAVSETLQTGLGTFYSRSRGGRWCKGETSGNFLQVLNMYADCDADSIIYLTDPIGPSCHTGAKTCWFNEISLPQGGSVQRAGSSDLSDHQPRTTLLALEHTIAQRKAAMAHTKPGDKPSWTARLLSDPVLLCKKIREEAGELCQTLEENEGKERAASEAADLLYHTMVLLNLQGVPIEDVMAVLRKRFGTSGIEEKAARPPKTG